MRVAHFSLIKFRSSVVELHICSLLLIHVHLSIYLQHTVQPCKDGSLRLAEGLPGSNNTGRVEMCVRNVWAGLCDSGFDDTSAEFVCSQLGLSGKSECTTEGLWCCI